MCVYTWVCTCFKYPVAWVRTMAAPWGFCPSLWDYRVSYLLKSLISAEWLKHIYNLLYTYQNPTEASVIYQMLGKSSSCGEAHRNKTKLAIIIRCFHFFRSFVVYLSKVDLNQPCLGIFRNNHFFPLFWKQCKLLTLTKYAKYQSMARTSAKQWASGSAGY